MANNVELEGRLVTDPEVKFIMHTANGDRMKYAFTVVTETTYGEKVIKDFVPCVAWGRTGDFIAKWFKKGYPIKLTGRISSYLDLETNTTVVEVNVNRADFVKDKKDAQTEEEEPTIDADDEDLPF